MNDISSNFIFKAEQLKQEKKYKEAIEILYKGLAEEPNNSEIFLYLADLYISLEDFERAIHYIEQKLEIEPKNVIALKLLFSILNSKNDYTKAENIGFKIFEEEKTVLSFLDYLNVLLEVKCFEKIILKIEEFYPETEDEKILEIYGIANFELNDTKAKTVFENILNINQENATALFYLGMIYYKEKEFKKSEICLKKHILKEENHKAWNTLGIISLQNNDIFEAIEQFTKAIKLNTSIGEYFYNLGFAYSLIARLDEAEKSFIHAIALDHENVHYKYVLAYLYYQKNEYEKCLSVLSAIKDAGKYYEDITVLISLIKLAFNNIPKAKNLLDSIDKETTNSMYYFAYAKLYKILSLSDKAIEMLKKAVEYSSDSMEYLSGLRSIYLENEDYENAEIIAKKIIEINPKYIVAYLFLTRIYLEQDDIEKTTEQIEKALSLDINNAGIYYFKALIAMKEKDYINAIVNLKSAISLEPDNPKYYFELGTAKEMLHEYDNAFLYYKEASLLEEGNVKYKYKTAQMATKMGQFRTADFYFNQCLRQPVLIQDIFNSYIDCLLVQKRYRKILRIIKVELKKNSKNSVITKDLLELREKIKKDFLKTLSPFEKTLYFLFGI